LVNILEAGAERNGQKIAATDLVAVVESGGTLRLVFPSTFTGPSWRPSKLFPLEVIDGQHRLWAFDGFDPGDDFELPVVAFYGLDRSWQAYLFWSVNITPKRINRSLAFDLYPLLRQEDWLDRFSGHSIYRETRSQELVEALWANSESPWHHRINMLGERKAERERPVPMVSQAAWIRSLMATLVKSWDGPSTKFGGLFGASAGEDAVLLPWTRAMQAALLIFAGTALRTSIERSKAPWAQSIRSKKQPALFPNEDPAFYGEHSLLTTDQGIRGFLFVLNDLLFVRAKELALSAWNWESSLGGKGAAGATEERALGIALRALEKQPLAKFIELMAEGLASYDWRTSSFPGLSEDERLRQSIFRGSSGYKELRRQLLLHLAQQKGDPAKAAATVAQQLGFTKSK
jgi:hypothetical protein